MKKKESNGTPLDLKAASRRIGCSPFTLRQWAREGKIAYLRPGRNFLFTQDDIEAFLASSRVPASSATE
jgi:excisionase family DNA binding protein